jgi:NAD(P)-dependent dehydrogenase (short-subunit alcohol dehydrogenase family)
MERIHRRFENAAAIVTGGTSGIGRATCVALAREGARVCVTGRSPARMAETLASLAALPGGSEDTHLGLRVDVRSEEDMARMAAQTLERFGRIDILVASAGISLNTSTTLKGRAALVDLPAEAWDEIIDTNLRGMFLTNRAVLPAMIEQQAGEIVNVSSSLGTTSGWAYASAYCASKFGVMGLSEALAEEARDYGVRVQVMVPDAVDTPMLQASHLAVMRALTPGRVADCILEMLASPEDTILVNPMIEPFHTAPGPRVRNVLGR